jgi:hypothetical protein
MSRLTTGISGAIALVMISGAAQLALGGDLGLAPAFGRVSPVDPAALSGAAAPDLSPVNRSSKADRKPLPLVALAPTRTVSLKLNGFSDTSFLLRVPVVAGARSESLSLKPAAQKPTVACEPVVSMLTEVAKQLQPGRCVT